MRDYNDYQLLCFLTENGYKDSFKNLRILKEGLSNGTIILEAKKAEEVEEEPVEAEVPVEENQSTEEEEASEDVDIPAEETGTRVSISMPVDGSMIIDNQGKSVSVDAEGNVQASITESHFGFINGANNLLESFLTEDCGMNLAEYEELRTDNKVDSLKEIAKTVLSSIESKLSSIDTSFADRSRGDIKQLRELPQIQDAITKIEAMLERDDSTRSEYAEAINVIIKAMLNINQYSSVFKDAYRNKKVLLILKYQSLILSIVSSVSYILSAIVDFTNVSIKPSVDFDPNIAPLQTLRVFNDSVENGEFKKITTDVNVLREYYLEVPVENMSSILEATDYVGMIVNGVRNIYTALSGNTKITNLVYKAVGVVVLLLSLRDSLYSLFRMKTKVSDMLGGITAFANLGTLASGNITSKLAQFANRYKVDAESGSDMSKREIEDENRQLLGQIKEIQANTIVAQNQPAVEPETVVSTPVNTSSSSVSVPDPFGFDF